MTELELKQLLSKITRPDETARTLTVSDNGIGMDKDEMENNLGTICRSGSLQFKQTLDKDKAADAASDQKTDGGTAGTEAEPPKHDPWEMIWTGQRGMLNEIKETAVRLSDGFSDQAANLTGKVQPYEEEARRLLVLANTFKNWPNPMEAVSRRITVTVTQLNQVLEPVMLARSEADRKSVV